MISTLMGYDEELAPILEKIAHRIISRRITYTCCSKIFRGVLELNDYEELISAIKNCKVTVVNFYSTNCPYCRAYHPVFEYVASKYSGRAGFYRLNIDYNPEIAWRMEIMGTPTTIIFVNGKQINQLYGYITPEVLERHVVAALDKAKCLNKG